MIPESWRFDDTIEFGYTSEAWLRTYQKNYEPIFT
jgi:hypothetical protein